MATIPRESAIAESRWSNHAGISSPRSEPETNLVSCVRRAVSRTLYRTCVIARELRSRMIFGRLFGRGLRGIRVVSRASPRPFGGGAFIIFGAAIPLNPPSSRGTPRVAPSGHPQGLERCGGLADGSGGWRWSGPSSRHPLTGTPRGAFTAAQWTRAAAPRPPEAPRECCPDGIAARVQGPNRVRAAAPRPPVAPRKSCPNGIAARVPRPSRLYAAAGPTLCATCRAAACGKRAHHNSNSK